MNLRNLSGHTVDVDRLPERPVVLDVGARGFDFSNDILNLRPDARIIALDPDPDIERLDDPRISFMHVALVHDRLKKISRYASYSTGEGNMLLEADSYYDAKIITVDCVTIQELMQWTNVAHWDLVKLDCEGSEFDILANWPGPIADQISVEFHDGHPEEKGPHRDKWSTYFFDLFERKLPMKVIQHELFKQGAWYGHWDSLLVL